MNTAFDIDDLAEFTPFGHHSCYKNILTIQIATPPAREPEYRTRREAFGELRYNVATGHLAVRGSGAEHPDHLSAPEFVSIALTARCNLRCAHCYPTVYNSTLPFETVTSLLHQLADMQVFSVALSGGEPLMHPQFDDIAALAARLGFRVLLFTNGTYVDADRARELAALGIGEVNVSIDSADAQAHDAFRGREGAFERSVAAVRHLVDAGLTTWVTCTVSDSVDVDPLQLTKLAVGAGAHKLRFVEVVDSGQARNLGLSYDKRWIDKVDQVLAYVREELGNDYPEADYFDFRSAKNIVRSPAPYSPYGCGAGSLRVRITARGKVLACPFLEDDVPMADGTSLSPDGITDRSFGEIWRDSPYLTAFRAGTRNVEGKCGACSQNRAWCASGCRADAFFRTRQLNQSDPHCRYGAEYYTGPQPEPGRTYLPIRPVGGSSAQHGGHEQQ